MGGDEHLYIPLKKFCDELVKNNITLRESDVAAIVNRIEEEASRISQTVRIQKAYEEAARQFEEVSRKRKTDGSDGWDGIDRRAAAQ